jgi:hypothetical protein
MLPGEPAANWIKYHLNQKSALSLLVELLMSLSVICCESNILKPKKGFYQIISAIFKNQLKEIYLRLILDLNT